MIELYTGIAERAWNREPIDVLGQGCVSPVYGNKKRRNNSANVPAGTRVIQDSGAFSDNWSTRLTFKEALERQIAHAQRYHYDDMVEYRASYDLLIDEVWHEGQRFKKRWTESAASEAVDTTVAAAKFAHENRDGTKLILSAQGVTAKQYLECTERVVPHLRSGDALGLGGWCIIGKMPKRMMPVFLDTLKLVMPFAGREGVKRIHIWGVIYPAALGNLLWWADQFGISISTDSTGPTTLPVFSQWGYGEWRDNSYKRPDASLIGKDRVRHVKLTREWLLNFRRSPFYQLSDLIPQQMELPFVA